MKGYVIAAVWLVSVLAAGWWQNGAGHVAERVIWQTKENTELRKANDKIILLEEGNRKAEQGHTAALVTISNDYERKLSDANSQRSADAAAVRAGTLRLRDPITTGLRSCGSLGGEAGASPVRRDGGAAGELSAEASGFLLSLASDADDITRQLAACQAVVVKDRELR